MCITWHNNTRVVIAGVSPRTAAAALRDPVRTKKAVTLSK